MFKRIYACHVLHTQTKKPKQGLCLLDRFKRRTLLMWSAGVQAAAQVAAAALFGAYLKDEPGASVPPAGEWMRQGFGRGCWACFKHPLSLARAMIRCIMVLDELVPPTVARHIRNLSTPFQQPKIHLNVQPNIHPNIGCD